MDRTCYLFTEHFARCPKCQQEVKEILKRRALELSQLKPRRPLPFVLDRDKKVSGGKK